MRFVKKYKRGKKGAKKLSAQTDAWYCCGWRNSVDDARHGVSSGFQCARGNVVG